MFGIPFHAFGLGVLGFSALVPAFFPAVSAAEPVELQASVAWTGECDDRAALAREMRARGVALAETTSEPSRASIELRVRVRRDERQRLDALLELRDERGARQERSLETGGCAELYKALAWMLVVLAREQELALDDAPGGARSAAFPDPPAPLAPRADAPAAPPAVADRAEPRLALASKPREPAEPRAESRLGSAFVSGLGLAPALALGPELFFEHRPALAWFPALRLSGLKLTSLPFSRGGTSVAVDRLAARLGAWVPTGWEPLRLAASAELGRLVASGSGASLAARTDRATWLAAGLAAELEMPVIRGVLRAGLGAGADYVPRQYAFRYRAGPEHSRTERFELRIKLGLSSSL